MDHRTARGGRGVPPVSVLRNYMILLIFFLPSPAHPADGLGRLFLTPDQRSQLETVRAQRDRRLPANADAEAAPAATIPTGPGVVTYNGVVRRSDGSATVWINSKPVNERSKGKNDSEVSVLGLRRDGAVAVAIPQAGRTASLKVGQRLDVTSGRIEEPYSRRETLVRSNETAAAPDAPTSTALPPPSVATGTTRPLRDSDTKEADPARGSVPAIRQLEK